MKRKLGKFETASAITGENAAWNIIAVIFLEGLPSQEVVRQALDILQGRYPLLRVRLIKEGGSHFFESGEISALPLNVIDREGDDHWIAVAEDNLNYQFDQQQGPLMQCTFLTGGANIGEIIIAAHHSIVDGTSVDNFSHELVELCTKIASGSEVEDLDPRDLALPVEEYFPPEYKGFNLRWKTLAYFLKQMADEFKYQLSTRGKRKPPIDTNACAKIIQIQTAEEITSRLVKKARKERVTINSVVNAAVLLSVQKHLYGGAESLYRYMSMAGLRPYLEPVPPVDQMGSYIAPMRYTIQVFAGDDLWSLAQRINDQIYKAMKRGERYLASITSAQFLRMTFSLNRFRMSATAISYTSSSIRPSQSYEPFKITAIRGFVSNFGMGPEFSGLVGLYDDELCWDMLYLDSDMDQEGAQLISDEIQHILESAVQD